MTRPIALARTAAVAAVLAVAGCIKDQPPAALDVGLLAKPAPALMEPPGRMPDIPDCGAARTPEARAACRASYDATQRGMCADTGERLIGLQAYVRALHGTPAPASPAAHGKRATGV